jgi:GxxExxY protein
MRATSVPRILADQRGLVLGELTEKLIGVFFDIYNELGHGFLESVYEEAFSVSLAERGIFFQRQMGIPVWFHGHKIGDFRADVLVEGKVIIELKAGRVVETAWQKQLLHYLRATEIEVGLLFNFGQRADFRRLVFANDRKQIRENPRESAETKLIP